MTYTLEFVKKYYKAIELVLKENDKLGGQHKIPRLSNQRDYLEQLKQMNVVSNSKK